MNHFNKRTNELQPYVVSSRGIEIDDDWLVLDWNESTIRIEDYLKIKLEKFINKGDLNFYGDVDCTDLKRNLHNALGISESFVTFFNGSDSALNICFETLLEPGDKVLTIEPEYSQVSTFIHMKGGIKSSFLLTSIDKPSIDDLNRSLNGIKVFYFSNPNNPIGFYFTIDEIESMLVSNPTVMFLVDEAYFEFSNSSAVDLIPKYSNLIIFRTFSKAFGLAGIRLGYIISTNHNISMINKVRNGKEVNSVAQFCASVLLQNFETIKLRIQELLNTRDWFFNQVRVLPNFEVFPSKTNFLLLKHNLCKEIILVLRQNKILVRDRSSMHLLENCFRISIGTKVEMERVLQVLKQF
ncbi:MAG: histidinol-phosphate aminotransferase family protein [Chitinophagaceae bacterium]|nr:histidinol-phosphate aminotransferase family protein [Chitinophagaceae bacterium]